MLFVGQTGLNAEETLWNGASVMLLLEKTLSLQIKKLQSEIAFKRDMPKLDSKHKDIYLNHILLDFRFVCVVHI